MASAERVPLSTNATPATKESMSGITQREIPYNYTSADDRRVLALLLGETVLIRTEE